MKRAGPRSRRSSRGRSCTSRRGWTSAGISNGAFAGGQSLEPVLELPSIESILLFVAYGFGSSVLPAFAVADRWRKRLVVRDLGRTLAPLEIRSCVERRRAPSRAAAAFLETCRTPGRPAAVRPVSPASSG